MKGDFAIPHGQSKIIRKTAAMFVVKTDQPIADWKTLDNKPVTVVIAYLIPENGNKEHIHYLSDMAQNLMNPSIVHAIHTAKTEKDVYSALNA
ncbi:hypothetical protein EWH99_10440 [Sporolactobacillus sp. THM7-7]|nr:hypothetical protein EWH99_10440 [Sporolactobacillus sp. THM7-7]